MRILCVLMPHFPLQCEIQRRLSLDGCPTIVAYESGSQRLVLDWSAGLKEMQSGMPVQQAIYMHGDARLISADIKYYSNVFERLLDALEGVSPLVEEADPGCVYLGLDGLQLIYESKDALIDATKRVIPKGFDVRLGIAEGKFPAYLSALYSSSDGPRDLDMDPAFLKGLSCDVLPVSIKSKEKLRDFGLQTVGQVSALSLGPLQSQFGPEGKRIWELARGDDSTPLYPRGTQETIEKSIVPPSATVSLDAILAGVESLLSGIFSHKALEGKGICSLVLWANIWGSGYWEQNIKFKEPSINTRTTLSRIKHVIENHPPAGPVEELGIKVTALRPQSGRQKNFFSEVRAKDNLLDDIKQMELRLGGPQVFKVKEIEPWSRIPERRQALVPISQ